MKTDVYSMVTERIIEELEKGEIPWEKPWTGVRSGAFNRVSKKPYSLLNQMILRHSGEYATFHQWSELGGRIKKDEKAEKVVFWKFFEKEEEDENGERVKKQHAVLKFYNVFHISQIEGVEPLKEELLEVEPIQEADDVIKKYIEREQLKFEECFSNDAYYNPRFDKVVVPKKEQYHLINEYYSTTFHELIHSTGHTKRLNRMNGEKFAAFGNEEYSKEELIAELGSSYLLNLLGIETKKTFRNSAAYIKNWLTVLKNDNKFFVSASSKAEKAVKYLYYSETGI